MRDRLRKKLLITGGTGFIGSALARRLSAAEGVEAIVLSRRDGKSSGNISYLRADITDQASMDALARETGQVDCLVCLASLIPHAGSNGPGASRYVAQNIGSTINLLGLLEKRAPSVVYVSTLDVYGPIKKLPVNESHPTEPSTIYGMTKLASENILGAVCGELGLPLSILRLSQVYGPGEPVIKAIPSFMSAISAGKEPVLYGDGSDMRDYVYVDDVVSAVLNAIERRAGGVYNIAGGRAASIREVLDLILKISGSRLKPRFEPRTKKRMDIYFDISRAKEGLGWAPEVSLEEGLEQEFRFFSDMGGNT
ncbi:MAG: NAD-dependent epimerase/dehydratase family protein [Deltaproteobacteria bacterium]|nr:NAD-dependent epimerase/dehydratase family protein [Deltaproteobacteria bacterium]